MFPKPEYSLKELVGLLPPTVPACDMIYSALKQGVVKAYIKYPVYIDPPQKIELTAEFWEYFLFEDFQRKIDVNSTEAFSVSAIEHDEEEKIKLDTLKQAILKQDFNCIDEYYAECFDESSPTLWDEIMDSYTEWHACLEFSIDLYEVFVSGKEFRKLHKKIIDGNFLTTPVGKQRDLGKWVRCTSRPFYCL